MVLTAAPATPLLVLAGMLTGVGGGLVITPLLVELSRRSRDADRGSAFSLFSAANATALAAGSIGGAFVVATSGFGVAMLATLVAHRGCGGRRGPGPRPARPVRVLPMRPSVATA